MRQGHSAYAGPRLCTQGEYLCLQLRAVFTPPWALLIQRLFHRLHDPPSWGRCPLQAVLSRWDRQLHTNKQRREYDRDLYKTRHLIENFFARLKQYRAIATRYDKTARNFLGAIHLVASMVWLA